MTRFCTNQFQSGLLSRPHNDDIDSGKLFAVTLLLYFGLQNVEDRGVLGL